MEYYSWKRIFFLQRLNLQFRIKNNSTLSLSVFAKTVKILSAIAKEDTTMNISNHDAATLSHRKSTSKSSMDRFSKMVYRNFGWNYYVWTQFVQFVERNDSTFFHNVVSSEWAPGCFSSPTSAHRDVCTSSSFNRVWPTYPPDSSVSSVYSHVLAAKYIGISIIRLV